MTNKTVNCGGSFYYDKTFYSSSKAIDWDLVCEKRWMHALLQSTYMFGVLAGGVILGALSDTFGRKPVFCVSGISQLVFGVASAFMPNYSSYGVSLFLYGMFGSAGAYVTGFVLTMELVGSSKRSLCGLVFNLIYAVGSMLVAPWAYLIKNHKLLQSVYASHSLLLIGHWWLVDESIRWLWGKGRYSDALQIAKKAMTKNKKSFEGLDTFSLDNVLRKKENKIVHSSPRLFSLFRLRNLRLRTLNTGYNWFANSFAYYGLYFSVTQLEGNPYFLLFLNALVEMPGYLIVFSLVDKTGRRPMLFALLLVGGVACVIIAFLANGIVVTTIAMLSKAAIAGSFALIYNYTVELFPTQIRNTALGICAMSAKTSGLITPMVLLLDVDTHAVKISSLIFGSVTIVAAYFTLFLPETRNKRIPETIDGERFGRGDTAFRTLCIWLGRRSVEKEDVDSPRTLSRTETNVGSRGSAGMSSISEDTSNGLLTLDVKAISSSENIALEQSLDSWHKLTV